MSDAAAEVNHALERACGPLFALLSALGRAAVYPPDIPFQAAEARGKRYNATIGQITDGAGEVLAPPALRGGLRLPSAAANRALLYSPVEGSAELRRRWRERQRREATGPSTLPVVVTGLTHGLSLVADLFAEAGRSVVVPAPFWGNYRQIFALRRGARVVPVSVYEGGAFRPEALAAPLADLPAGEPALVVANFPSNPVGYTPTAEERERLVAALVKAAADRPLLVVCDDAYAGLVFAEGIPADSLFWHLSGRHERLVPVKVDGCTKELVFFGGRVGFVTFALEPDSEGAEALESKCKCLVRATVGSPVSTSQELVLAALADEALEEQIGVVRGVLAERYRVLRDALADVDPACGQALPFNSGCFALVELPEAVDPEALRRKLLREADTGVVAIAPRYVRLAYCSIDAGDIPELVSRVAAAARSSLG